MYRGCRSSEHAHEVTERGYVTRSALQEAMKRALVVDVEVECTPSSMQGDILEILPPESSLRYEGISQHRVFNPSNTDLEPSLVHGVMGPAQTQPSVLSPSDPRLSPEYQGKVPFFRKLFSGYKAHKAKFMPNELEMAYVSMREDMISMSKKSIVKMKKLSLLEAINGINIPANTRIDLSTSAGYPFVQQGKTKKSLFDERDGIIYPKADVQARFDQACQKIESGVVPFLPFTLTLKDERVKLKKIATPKSRIFACGNLTHFLVCRRYFYTRMMQIYHAPLRETYCYPALDRVSFDWHRLSCHMLEAGREGFDFDFEWFDRSLQHALIYYSAKVLLAGMEVTQVEELTLLEMLSSPFFIFENHVFSANGVEPSGGLLTYLINCTVNELLHRAAWTHIMSDLMPAIVEIRHYKRYTRGERGGDDTFTTVHPEVAPYFNGKTVAEFLIKRGMGVTDAEKNAEIVPLKPYEKLSFLKNKTEYKDGLYLPICDIDSLYESTYWIRQNKLNRDKLKATQDNIICSLRGIFFHGEEVFNTFRTKCLEACPELILPQFGELAVIWRNYYNFPGAHADYAARDLQQDPFVAAIQQPRIIRPIGQEPDHYKNMLEKETLPESGPTTHHSPTDVLSAELAPIETAPVQVDTTPLDSQVVKNVVPEAESKQDVKRVGATIQDAADMKLMPVHTGDIVGKSANARAEMYLNDVNWDLKKLIHKFTFVKSVDWAIADAPETILASFRIPQDVIVTPAMKAPFDVTRWWRCTQVRMKIVIKASPFYAGSLGIGFTPFGGDQVAKKMVNMGAQIVKVSQEEGIEFVIPFRLRQGFLDVTSGATLGTFCIFVVSKLATSTTNIGTIPILVYAAIENSEFKLPEPIPAALYKQYKNMDFRMPQSVIKAPLIKATIPQSGKVSVQLCDINDPVRSMPKTVLCAGPGLVGKPKVAHFQDAPSCLVQMAKRWTLLNRTQMTVVPGQTYICSLPLSNLAQAATQGFSDLYALWRGSINMRVRITSSQNANTVRAWTSASTDNTLSFDLLNQGAHFHDCETLGQVTVPWLTPYFVEYTVQTGYDDLKGFVYTNIEAIQNDIITVEFYVCVGDDFHLGIFTGGNDSATACNYATYEFGIEQRATTYTQKFPPPPPMVSKFTRPQSGIIEFIDTAIENTLPLVERISSLGLLQDAHMLTEQPHPIQIRPTPYSIASDLPQYTERLLTLNHNGMSLPDQDCFGVGESETKIYNLLQNTKSWDSNVAWTDAMPTGTELIELRTYTGPGVPAASVPGHIHNQIPPMFSYWTGSNIVILDIIATEMHRGQLLITFNTKPEPIGYGDATQTYFTTYDLSSGRGTICIRLPYLSDYPYRECINEIDARSEFNSTGLMQVFIQNPLRSTPTVAPSVDIVKYVAYGEDFQLGVYGNVKSIPPPSTK
jgi:hypothetical protein